MDVLPSGADCSGSCARVIPRPGSHDGLPGWSADAILEEVLVTSSSASLPVADLRSIERPGWVQMITPSFRTDGLNEVVFSALADDEVDAVIDATTAEYRAVGVAFR